MSDDGYQIKTRWHGDVASTLWTWGLWFSTLDEAFAHKYRHEGALDRGWVFEIRIFHVQEIIDEHPRVAEAVCGFEADAARSAIANGSATNDKDS